MKTWRFVPLLALALAGCDEDSDGILVPSPSRSEAGAPRFLEAEHEWVLEGWRGRDPVGHSAARITWELPSRWDGEAFRVYGKRSTSGDYFRIATVTSCADGLCAYVDTNVQPGRSYDYFVATEIGAGANDEVPSSDAVRVDVPAEQRPETPAAPTIAALDGAVYLEWPSTGAAYYRVFLESLDGDSVFYQIGETDGTGFVDERAENGVRYGYRIAPVGDEQQVGRRSEMSVATPRPDYHAELIYALGDDVSVSGFRFQPSESDVPIVRGDAANAHWRLEEVNGVLSIAPRGGTRVTSGTFTTALTCGPEAESDCVSVTRAPAEGEFGTAPVPVDPGYTYVFQVTGDDGRQHYGKVRAQGAGVDSSGRSVLVFDWAYQLRPEDPNLTRVQ